MWLQRNVKKNIMSRFKQLNQGLSRLIAGMKLFYEKEYFFEFTSQLYGAIHIDIW